MVLSQSKITKLKEYFKKRDDALMAFLFGSFATGKTMYDSDVDIAVYFKPKGRAIEWEEERDWPEEDKIWSDLENIVERDVDLLVLNRARSSVAFNVLQTGIPLVIKDRSFYWRFYLLISSAAMDFREFIDDYRKIRERSRSVSEEDLARLKDLADFLESEMESYSEFSSLTQKIYQYDRNQKRNIEHWVESIVLSSIDLAKILLSSNKIIAPGKYADILKSLMALKDFDEGIAEKLSKFAHLRNVITHEYLDIRWKEIKKFINTSEPLYKYLVNFIKKRYLK